MPKPILLPSNGAVIPRFIPNVANSLNQMILFYGPSKTGKSFAMRSFLKKIQPYISFAMVVSPTEPSNKSYMGIVPDPFIHYDMTERTLALLEIMWERQEAIVGLYNLAHDTPHLLAIYKHCRTDESDKQLKTVLATRARVLKHLPKHNHKQRERRDRIKQQTDKLLISIYRKQIDRSREQLKSAPLTTQQWAIINNLHINPNMVLILDDCAAELKKFMNHDIIRKLAYQARHNHITTYIAAQDDTDIGASFRRNAHLSLFTTRGTMSMFTKRPTNGLDPKTRRLADEINNEIFGRANVDKEFEFVRMVYDRTPADGAYFKYLNEDPPSKFRLGGSSVWEYSGAVSVSDHSVNTNNRFYDVIIGGGGS